MSREDSPELRAAKERMLAMYEPYRPEPRIKSLDDLADDIGATVALFLKALFAFLPLLLILPLAVGAWLVVRIGIHKLFGI